MIKDAMKELITANFSKMDVNGDGSLDKGELLQSMTENGDFDFPPSIKGDSREAKLDAFFAKLDANHDGKITLEEMINGLNAFIDEAFDEAMAAMAHV